ncbi:unnamed protein product [Mytilus edulis]|uniref:Uncharacterized protein n=1 Tax=Mytilus edulis TaxID=6550 RepID=A0A8S3VR56_MYTED|nr:unnamed protein product [Mytilus edulis]
MSQFLFLGTVVNFTLAKRQEILDKSTVSEALQQRLCQFSLSKDKLFSVSLEQLQEELNKAPPVVKVDVKVTDGRRFVKTAQANNPSSQFTKRPAFLVPTIPVGRKLKLLRERSRTQPNSVHRSKLMGWGAYLEWQDSISLWSGVSVEEHINLLEMRAVFLLSGTLATGRRRSEIHALSISESCLRLRLISLQLLFSLIHLLAKNQLPDKGSGLITIPALPPTADNQSRLEKKHSCKESSDKEIDDAAKDWRRLSLDREGGKKQRREKRITIINNNDTVEVQIEEDTNSGDDQ